MVPATLGLFAANPALRFQEAFEGPSTLVLPLVVGAVVCVLIGAAAIAFFRVRSMRKLSQQSVLSDHVFAAFFGDAHVGIAVLDEHGAIVRSNSVFEDMIGYAEEDLIGMLYFDLVDHPDQGDVRERIVGALDRFGESHHLVLRRSDGGLVRARFVVTPAPATLSRKNSVVFVEEVGSENPTVPPDGDLEGRRSLPNREAGRIGTQSESVSSGPRGSFDLERFVAALHDEIKTPLTVLVGNASILKSEVSSENADVVAAIEASSQQLVDTLDGLLHLARLRFAAPPSVVDSFDLRLVLMDVADRERPRAKQKGLFLSSSVPSSPVVVEADRDAVTRVLTQLIQNALKFTDDGNVHASIEMEAGRVRLQVSDTGAGFAPDVRGELFTPFYQESSGSRRRYRGAGIGLALVDELVTRMGGSVHADATPGAGATFTVTLPVKGSVSRAA